MDVKGSEWNDERIVVRMWVGTCRRVHRVCCNHGYKILYMVLVFIAVILHVLCNLIANWTHTLFCSFLNDVIDMFKVEKAE